MAPGRLRPILPVALAWTLLAGCSAGAASPSASTQPHPAHDAATLRVIGALESDLGVVFEPAGPHHELGRAPGGVELDLVGVPVEEIVLSVPADDPQAGQAYLPYLRDLLHGPDRVYDWASAMLGCRAVAGRACDEFFEQGNLVARFSDGGPGYIVLTLARGP